MGNRTESFGRLSDGSEAHLYTIAAGRLTAKLTDLGAALVSLIYTDEEGRKTDVVLGYDSAAEYEGDTNCFGATVGRNANRIAGASFELHGKRYQLTANEGENNLHSGPDFYHKRIWQTEGVNCDGSGIVFTLVSPDGDQGYPGTFEVSAAFVIEGDSLHVQYEGFSDADTIVNMTNHSYFNLNGEGSGSIAGHRLRIQADSYTPVRAGNIPTGEVLPVLGTVFDFTDFREIGEGLESGDVLLRDTNGYDHNYVLKNRGELDVAAEAVGERSGIRMTLLTDRPGMQFYTGNFIGNVRGKGGKKYANYTGFALEPQFYPDSVHEPDFPQPVVKKGELVSMEIVYRFSSAWNG